jgi:hypothetical protein
MFNLTFLNALFLAGMAAGVVPIIIHLLNRRRLKRVEFSDLRFIAPLNQQRMRSLNLRRLLLLMLRVFIVVFTALAMARPSVRGSFSKLLPTQARSSVLLLVDTSYSMRMEDENGTALDAAKAMALRLVDVLERGDQVNVMTFEEAPRREFQTPVHDLALARQKIEELQAGHGGTGWSEAVKAALEELAEVGEPNRELYVISDFAGADLDSVQADLGELQGEVRVSFVPVEVEPFVNVSVEDVQVPPGAILRDEPVRVGVTVRNHGLDVPAECNLQVELGGEPKGEASLRLAAGAQQTHEFTLVATQASETAGLVRKRIDRLTEDDVRYFVLPVLGQLHVLLVAGARDEGGSFFLSRALAPGREGASPLQVAEVDAPRFSSQDLQGVQVVVLSGDAILTDGQAQVLVDFVRDGGGLTVFSGQRATADAFNRLLFQRMGGARLRGVVQQQSGFQNLSDLRPSGILSGFGAEELRALETVKFTRYAELAAGEGARRVLQFAGGQPAMVEGAHGSGKYMLFGFDAALDGSDLAVSPMFLPLVHRSVVYLAGETGRQKMTSRVGERIEVQVPVAAARSQASLDADPETRYAQAGTPDGGVRIRSRAEDTAPGVVDERSFTVTTPSGEKEAVVARYVGKMAHVAYENTRQPGHYVFEGAGRRLVRAVNVDTRESDLRRLDLGDLEKRLGLRDVDTIEGEDSIARHVRESRHGKELYKLIVGLVLLLMTVELLLSRASRESAA